MAAIGKVLSYIKTMRGGGFIRQLKIVAAADESKECDYYQQSGDDSPPLPGDFHALISPNRTGLLAVVGSMDLVNEPKALPGEKRIYGRNDETKESVNQVYLKRDGTVVISNALGRMQIDPDGTVTLTNDSEAVIVIDPEGLITSQTGDSLFTLNADGTIEGSNAEGVYTLQPDGNLVANGATIDTSGNVITAAGSDTDDQEARLTNLENAYNIHRHTTTITGFPTSPTDTPVVTE